MLERVLSPCCIILGNPLAPEHLAARARSTRWGKVEWSSSMSARACLECTLDEETSRRDEASALLIRVCRCSKNLLLTGEWSDFSTAQWRRVYACLVSAVLFLLTRVLNDCNIVVWRALCLLRYLYCLPLFSFAKDLINVDDELNIHHLLVVNNDGLIVLFEYIMISSITIAK